MKLLKLLILSIFLTGGFPLSDLTSLQAESSEQQKKKRKKKKKSSKKSSSKKKKKKKKRSSSKKKKKKKKKTDKNIDSEDNLKLFKEGKINRLSCVLQLSEGVNIPNLKQGIIMHAYGNERKAAQRIGRLLRLNPDDQAIVHILCYKNTIDEKWVKDALEFFDDSKIEWRNFLVSSDKLVY